MSDLAQVLREIAAGATGNAVLVAPAELEAAADEIERLRRDISYLNPIADALQRVGRALGLLGGADLLTEPEAEIRRMRALLQPSSRPVMWLEAQPGASLEDALRGMTVSTAWHWGAERPKTARPENALWAIYGVPGGVR